MDIANIGGIGFELEGIDFRLAGLGNYQNIFVATDRDADLAQPGQLAHDLSTPLPVPILPNSWGCLAAGRLSS